MKLTALSSLTRSFNLSYRTNRAIFVVSLAVGAASAAIEIFTGSAAAAGLIAGVMTAASFFLAWVLSRELDPDRELSAFVAAGLAVLLMLWVGPPKLLALVWLVLILRLVNRTSGLPATQLDSLAVLALAIWLMWWEQTWIPGAITAVAFGLDRLLPVPAHGRAVWAALAVVATIGAGFYARQTAVPEPRQVELLLAQLAISLLFVLLLGGREALQSRGDRTGELLDPRRLRAARAVALATAVLFAWFQGDPGFVALGPLWAAMGGIGLFEPAEQLRKRWF